MRKHTGERLRICDTPMQIDGMTDVAAVAFHIEALRHQPRAADLRPRFIAQRKQGAMRGHSRGLAVANQHVRIHAWTQIRTSVIAISEMRAFEENWLDAARIEGGN